MTAKRVVLLGPPGSGKGTQSEHIQSKLGIIAISTGEMFRDAQRNQTPLGLEARKYMEAGELVPDDIVVAMVEERLGMEDCSNGYILDGFPRTIPQAQKLDEKVQLDLVLEIRCNFESIIKRISGRRVHPASGRIYHVESNPPKAEGKDDVTGEALEHRLDDREGTVRTRFEVYQKQTAALIEHYSKSASGARFATVNGEQPIEQVTADVFAALR